MTITHALAEYCAEIDLDEVTSSDVESAKKLLLDTVGTAVGGYHWTDSGRVFVETARGLGGVSEADGHAEKATVLATGEHFRPMDAAMANGALSHSLDYDNRHSGGSLHVGSSVVSAALAGAETAEADGRTLLEAVIAGYEVAIRLAMGCNPRSSHERGFHPTGTCGTFGATAAVGVVRGFATDEFVTAFGINGSQASGSYQCSLTGGLNKRLHPGLAARDAFVATELTRHGFDAAPRPIAGDLGFLRAYADRPVPEYVTDGLGTVAEFARTKIKPYPLGTFTHAPIAMLLDLREEVGLGPAAVEAIEIELPTSGAAMFGRSAGAGHPRTTAEAQFDMPFAAALPLVYGSAGVTAFHDAVANGYSDEFARLMGVTTTRGSEDLEAFLPEQYPARITVETRTETYTRYREEVKGEPDNPLTWAELAAKFDELAASLGPTARQRVVETVRRIETADAADLVAPFDGGEPSAGRA